MSTTTAIECNNMAGSALGLGPMIEGGGGGGMIPYIRPVYTLSCYKEKMLNL